jgi:hypothetical protein
MTTPPLGQPAQSGQPVGSPPYAAPQKKSKKTLYIVLGVVGSFLLLCGGCGAAFTGGTGDVATSPGRAAAQASPTAGGRASAGRAATVGVGKPVRDGNFQFTVTKVRCGLGKVGSNPYLTKKAQGQFCVVTLTVTNIKTEPRMLNDFDQKAFVGGSSYDADSTAGLYLSGDENSVWLNSINPGNTVAGRIVFDIPTGATLTKLELHDSGFSGGVDVDL